MLTPSRTLAISLAVIALASLVLGLATDVGLFGWSLAALLALYLAAAGLTRLARPRRSSSGRPA
jgi:membrane protein implicated in regulation of membrane protease activity